MSGDPVLIVTHYDDDHSWGFVDGRAFNPEKALLVAMSEVLELHPELMEVADLPPGWTASRSSIGAAWERQMDSD
jgi:hypothetical protein